ncbi:hypothetical protein BD309DRAFT_711625 [Dichomitus squalens]|nr:hypothetical protein BD309DRAFT_711625 [Dichomitus squalens]
MVFRSRAASRKACDVIALQSRHSPTTDSLDGLASLRDITVTAMIPDYIHFSDNTALPRVASMRIQVEGTSDNGDILRSFTSIRTNFSPAMITKLFVTGRDFHYDSTAVICLVYLQPLFELSNLRCLRALHGCTLRTGRRGLYYHSSSRST